MREDELKHCPFCGGETGRSGTLCGENYEGKWWCNKGDYNTRNSAERDRLREALEISKGQWIHSVNSAQCLEALNKTP